MLTKRKKKIRGFFFFFASSMIVKYSKSGFLMFLRLESTDFTFLQKLKKSCKYLPTFLFHFVFSKKTKKISTTKTLFGFVSFNLLKPGNDVKHCFLPWFVKKILKKMFQKRNFGLEIFCFFWSKKICPKSTILLADIFKIFLNFFKKAKVHRKTRPKHIESVFI